MKIQLKEPSFPRPGAKAQEYLFSAMNVWNTPLSLWGLSHVQVKEDGEILDIGCGGGKNLARLLKKVPKGHVCGIDSSFRAVDFSYRLNEEAIRQGRCHIYEGSADVLPFGENRFDLVVAEETFYFWKDPEAALAEVLRVLKPEGHFLVIHSKSGGPLDRVYEKFIPGMKIYNKEELKDLLEEAGFRDVSADSRMGALSVTAKKPSTLLDSAKRKLQQSTFPKRNLTTLAVSAAALGLVAYGISKRK